MGAVVRHMDMADTSSVLHYAATHTKAMDYLRGPLSAWLCEVFDKDTIRDTVMNYAYYITFGDGLDLLRGTDIISDRLTRIRINVYMFVSSFYSGPGTIDQLFKLAARCCHDATTGNDSALLGVVRLLQLASTVANELYDVTTGDDGAVTEVKRLCYRLDVPSRAGMEIGSPFSEITLANVYYRDASGDDDDDVYKPLYQHPGVRIVATGLPYDNNDDNDAYSDELGDRITRAIIQIPSETEQHVWVATWSRTMPIRDRCAYMYHILRHECVLAVPLATSRLRETVVKDTLTAATDQYHHIYIDRGERYVSWLPSIVETTRAITLFRASELYMERMGGGETPVMR